MGSSEIVDSGRPSAQKSNFSHTCTLLSQYLKEKGSFGDLSLGISRNFEAPGTAAQTMNLLPMIEKSGQNSGPKPGNLLPNFTKEETTKKTDSSVAKAETEKSQMTIFYGGQVLVFNDFPAEKVKEIMVLAKGGNTTQNPPNIFSYNNNNNNTPTLVSPKPAESSATNMVTPPAVPKVVPTLGNQKPITSDLPIARRHSLARFLEKRKDRVTSKAPYPIGNAMAGSSKPEESNKKAWLGLGAQIPVKIEHQS